MKRFAFLTGISVFVGFAILAGSSSAEAGFRHRRHRCCRPAACEPTVVECCSTGTVDDGAIGSDASPSATSGAEPVSSGEVISERPTDATKSASSAKEAPAAPAPAAPAAAAPEK